MSVTYLTIDARDGLTSAERADKLDAELWRLQRPSSVQSAGDTKYLYPRIVHPITGQVALIADTTDSIKVHTDVDSSSLLSLLSETSKPEKDSMKSYIQTNRDGKVSFETLIPSSLTQLTESEADAAGWLPDNSTP